MLNTMKKLVLLIIAVIFIAGMLVSCNSNVCPAYVMENETQQVENNS